jgi:carbon monoxide dehydrogenase subunit G
MNIQGTRLLPVTQQQAWNALNDPEVLKACIPGCEKIEATAADQYAVVVALRIGPVAARFNGQIQLEDIRAPSSYTLSFGGQGGAAGFGKGSASVNLKPAEGGSSCELTYAADAQVGGKIAQLGQRLVEGAARSMALEFFNSFEKDLRRRHAEPAADVAAGSAPVGETGPPRASPPATEAHRLTRVWGWALLALALAVAAAFIVR